MTCSTRHLLASVALLSACTAAVPVRGEALPSGPVTVRPILDAAGRRCCAASGHTAPVRMVVRTPEAWRDAWRQLSVGPAPSAAPEVDFARDMVMVVAAGTRPTGGWSIAVEAAEWDGATLRVSVLESAPGPRCMTIQVLTQPATAVVVPRVEGPVVFSVRTVERDCR